MSAKKTFYDVLGVPPDASQTKLKQAYIRLAQIHHPDRQTDASPAARQQAEKQMREVNEAWDAVRNPARREAYDRLLRGPGPAWETRTTSGGTRAPRTAPVRPGDDFPGPSQSGFVVQESHSAFWRFGPMVLLGFVLLGILIFTAYANQGGDLGPDTTAPQALRPFVEGDCILVATTGGVSTPILVSCDRTGAAEVRTVTDLGRPCGLGLVAYELPLEKTRLCLAE